MLVPPNAAIAVRQATDLCRAYEISQMSRDFWRERRGKRANQIVYLSIAQYKVLSDRPRRTDHGRPLDEGGSTSLPRVFSQPIPHIRTFQCCELFRRVSAKKNGGMPLTNRQTRISKLC
ncbi:hypothetical protein I6F30_08370 [Bradyrhizobium sp. NBAIM20]|uniref:hypothetical protein n=1 Tax=unclassified Bradyrhizobium TaxID=2631580 RepID=UPI001CD770FF|nr:MULTISPECIES: hypothetical protein [unclassified Bradyrhizobium]MCA1411173.1 hypothetical protein [Bradyrhizobium sp. NBAIM20]MCA1464017.1 hypothetical protein [Bradyrhizobium sp. NBAIM18]